MAKLLILRGAPGSGKSTWAAERQKQASEPLEIVSRDLLREQLLGGPEVFSDEGMITAVQNALITYHLSQGVDVIVDNTNCNWKYVRELGALARGVADIEIHVFDVEVSELKARNDKRAASGGRRVPDYVINHYHQQLQISKDWTL